MMPTEKLLPAGACPTTEPRAGGQAPAGAAAAGDAAGLAAGAGDAPAAGLAAGDAAAAGEAGAAAGDAGAAGLAGSVGFAGAAVGAGGAEGVQAASNRPDQARITDRREKRCTVVLPRMSRQQQLVVHQRLLPGPLESTNEVVHSHATPLVG
jgi:hypothetical protein